MKVVSRILDYSKGLCKTLSATLAAVSVSMVAINTPAMAEVTITEVTITLGDNIILLAENGKEISRKYNPLKNGRMTLANGTHQLLVQTQAVIELDVTDTDYLESHTHVLVFTTQDQHLVLSTPNLTSERDLNRFNRKPQWQLRDANGQNINITMATLEKDGLQLARNYELELNELNQSDSPVALPSLVLLPSHRYKQTAYRSQQATYNQTPPIEPITEQVVSSVSVGQLIDWYYQASPEVQSQFKTLINK